VAKSILVVEDNIIIAMVTRKTLLGAGYIVSEILSNGLEAIQEVRRNCPDLILMDIQLDEGADGIQTMIEIKKICSAPVIYLTGNSELRSKEQASVSGFSGFLIKPVQPRELLIMIEKVIGKA
jgi:two-component system chemotaxis response regulator CheY